MVIGKILIAASLASSKMVSSTVTSSKVLLVLGGDLAHGVENELRLLRRPDLARVELELVVPTQRLREHVWEELGLVLVVHAPAWLPAVVDRAGVLVLLVALLVRGADEGEHGLLHLVGLVLRRGCRGRR